MVTIDGKKLKHFRENRGLKLREVAENTGVGVQSISNYEQEVSKPSADVLLALLNLYGVHHKDISKDLSNNYSLDVISA